MNQERDENARLASELRHANLEVENLKSNSSVDQRKLEHCVQRARDAEAAEKKLNGTLHRELVVEQESSIKLRQKIRDLEYALTDSASCTTDEVDGLKVQIHEFKLALESARMDAQKAASERDEQIEDKLMALAKIDGLVKKEQRLQNHIRSLELRLQNASSANSDHSSNDGESDKQNLYQVRCGLEACRQQLGALASRLMVAAVRSDNDEIKASKEEITEAHRNLAFYSRLINSTRSAKRAQDSGLLEERLRDQLTNLKLNSDRLHELQAEVCSDSQSLSEFKLRSDAQRKQIDQLTSDKLTLQNKLDEMRLSAPEQWNNENSASATQLVRKQQKTYERYARAESSRKALVYQKKYLLMTIGGFQNTEQVTLATLSKIGGFKNPGDEKAPLSPKRRFIAAVNAIRAVTRLKFLTRSWVKRITKSRSHSAKDALQNALTNRINFENERGVY